MAKGRRIVAKRQRTAGKSFANVDGDIGQSIQASEVESPKSPQSPADQPESLENALIQEESRPKRIRLRLNLPGVRPQTPVLHHTKGGKTVYPSDWTKPASTGSEESNFSASEPAQPLGTKRDRNSVSVSHLRQPLLKKVKLLVKTSVKPSPDRVNPPSKGGKTIPLSYFFSAKRLPNLDYGQPSAPAQQHSTGISVDDLHGGLLPASSPSGTSFISENGREDDLPTHQSLSEEGDESVPSANPLAPDPATYIPFGELRSTTNPKICYTLEMLNDRTGTCKITVGWNKDCQFRVFGPGVGMFHCAIFLRLGVDKNGHLVREVVVQKMESLIIPATLTTTVRAEGEKFVVNSTWVLKSGQTVQFGQGDEYRYEAPKVWSLYRPTEEDALHEGDDLNSTVVRVKGRYDGFFFVAKTIPSKYLLWAKSEIEIFGLVGRHPRIVQFIEAFHDSTSLEHHLIFELGSNDLLRFAPRNRTREVQDMLRRNSTRWTKQITEGIEHLHNLDISHRDLKPENILTFISDEGRVDLKVMDLGLARQCTGPITEEWFVGTNTWAAPGPFMIHPDDKVVDLYGIGRILFFVLTQYEWPVESRDVSRLCSCRKACVEQCVRREAAFRAVKHCGAECLDFLRHLLVASPELCMMNVREMLDHPYFAEAEGSVD